MRRRRTKDLNRASLQSTLVLQRRRAVGELLASLAAQSDTVVTGLESRFREVLEDGEDMLDFQRLLSLLRRLLERANEQLDSADSDRFMRAMELKVLREEVRRTKIELRGHVMRVRKALVDLFGSAPVRLRFGLAERTPRGTVALADEARRLVVGLADPELSLPEPLIGGLQADPEGWASSLEPATTHLNRLLEELERRRVGASDGILEQRRALDDCDETYLQVARIAEALFHLAGEDELARRLRPKTRLKRRRLAIQNAANGWRQLIEAGWGQVTGLFQLARGFLGSSDV